MEAKPMSDNFRLLKHELLKDYWTLKDALYIVCGWIGIDDDPHRLGRLATKYNKNVPITKTNLKRPDQRLYNDLMDLWKATNHDFADGDQRNYNMYSERQEYRVTYILKWCKKKQVEVPWFDWAVEQELIDPLDFTEGYPSNSVTENGNTGANQMPENDAMGTKKEENLYRLIGILKDIAMHKTGKNQKELIEFMHAEQIDTSDEALKSRGLGERMLKDAFAKANDILKNDKL